MKQTVTVQLGQQNLTIETGFMAKQADGSALVTAGNNVVLVTAVSSKKDSEMDFFPLTVEYSEKFYASGKIPGGFFKREGRPTAEATLNARLIDRPLRPLFPEDYNRESQIVATILSYDGTYPIETLASLGASTAIHISDIPFNGPTATVMVGYVNGQMVVNPSPKQLKRSELELIVAGTKKGLLMVEGSAKLVSESLILSALKFAHEQMAPLFSIQDELREKAGNRTKRDYTSFQVDQSFRDQVTQFAQSKVAEALKN